MEHQNKKVFINPNFNRVGTHLNKNFTHIIPNTHCASNSNNTRKIFVNPNFLPTNKAAKAFQTLKENGFEQQVSNSNVSNYAENVLSYYSKQKQSSIGSVLTNQDNYHQVSHEHKVNCNTNKEFSEVPRSKSKYSLIRNSNVLIKQTATYSLNQDTAKLDHVNSKEINTTTTHVTKSRYCIIRNNKLIKEKSINAGMDVKNNTIKISKYKTIKISTLKDELKKAKPTSLKFSYQTTKQTILVPKNISHNALIKTIKQSRYKYKNTEGNDKKVKLDTKHIKHDSFYKRRIINRSSKNKSLVVGKYKINNIPCPLYVKYGKCLRKCKGTCDYLHDKKHVSLCRKFIKGLCHDDNCLLSHELSDKKMPTCYFYLNGMCTKESCPYVHVKLSNKTKICKEFQKGYCEKGENCLERHVLLPYHFNKNKIQNEKLLKTPSKVVLKLKKRTRLIKTPVAEEIKQSESDNRYFKDNVNEDEQCEAIKPVRCKLGTLPSYIQLL